MQKIFKVIDASMAPKIREGDVIKTRRAKPRDGDCVVAQVNGALLLRKLSRQNGEIVLSPLNPAYRARHFSEEEWKSVDIVGVAITVETPRALRDELKREAAA